MSVYEGTLGQQEYRHGFDNGRAAAEWEREHYPSTVWDRMAATIAVVETSSSYASRAYWLGWLRGYREVIR